MDHKLNYCCLFFLSLLCSLSAQEEEKQPIEQIFKTTRLVAGHSAESFWKGQLMFSVSHRFAGTVDEGVEELFGLDGTANIRLALAYSITDNLNLEIGRTRLGKFYDGNVKWRFLRQQKQGNPITLALVAGGAIRSQDWPEDQEPFLDFSHRLSYFSQLLIARQINPFLSFQLMPTWVHRNLTPSADQSSSSFAMGGAVAIQLKRGILLSGEYIYHARDNAEGTGGDDFHDVLGLSLDFITTRHTFQLQFTNTTQLVDPLIITETRSDFFDQGVHIGFRITRFFGS